MKKSKLAAFVFLILVFSIAKSDQTLPSQLHSSEYLSACHKLIIHPKKTAPSTDDDQAFLKVRIVSFGWGSPTSKLLIGSYEDAENLKFTVISRSISANTVQMNSSIIPSSKFSKLNLFSFAGMPAFPTQIKDRTSGVEDALKHVFLFDYPVTDSTFILLREESEVFDFEESLRSIVEITNTSK